jgi:hypothetical protein
MTKRSWVQTPAPYTDGCKQFASYYIKRKIENKGSQMGHTKKYFKKPLNK